jgi:hypothetical protein
MFLAVPVVGVFAAVWRNLLTALGDQPPALGATDAPMTPVAPITTPPGLTPAPAEV